MLKVSNSNNCSFYNNYNIISFFNYRNNLKEVQIKKVIETKETNQINLILLNKNASYLKQLEANTMLSFFSFIHDLSFPPVGVRNYLLCFGDFNGEIISLAYNNVKKFFMLSNNTKVWVFKAPHIIIKTKIWKFESCNIIMEKLVNNSNLWEDSNSKIFQKFEKLLKKNNIGIKEYLKKKKYTIGSAIQGVERNGNKIRNKKN